MKMRAAWFCAALASAGCTHEQERQEKRVVTMTTIPRFDGPPTSSYSVVFGSSARSSRIGAPRRKFAGVERFALPEGLRCSRNAPNLQSAARLTLSPDGAERRLDNRDLGRVRFVDGSMTPAERRSPWEVVPGGTVLAEKRAADEGLLVNAVETQKGDSLVTVQREPHDAPIGLVGKHRFVSGVHGTGIVGAIDGAWFSAFAYFAPGGSGDLTPHPRLAVYGPESNGQSQGVMLVDQPLSFVPYDMSLVAPFVVFVAHGGTGPRVHALRGDGHEAWALEVPFETSEPPNDGGDGRVYVVGTGLLTIDQGKIVSTVKSPTSMLATAFADGSLALVTGQRVELVARNGTIEQQFETGERIVTQPAIAPNGDVWVASDDTIFVLK
jgi:hypothetical protein